MKTQSKLRKKSFTVVEQACHQIRGYKKFYEELDDKVRLSGHSAGTLTNIRWRDYRNNQQKIMALDGTGVLRRYCQHMLPYGFVRIRYYGLLSATRKDQFRKLQLSTVDIAIP